MRRSSQASPPALTGPLAWLVLLVLLCATALLPARAAQPPEPAASATRAGEEVPQVLRLHNRPVHVFQGRLASYGPAERLEGAEQRVERELSRAVARGQVPVIESRREGEMTSIVIDGRTVFFIVQGDLNTMGDATLESEGAAVAARLRTAFSESLETRSTRAWLTGSAWALGATLLFAATLALLSRLSTRLQAALSTEVERRAGQQLPGAVAGQRWVLAIRQTVLLLVRLVHWTAVVLLGYLWLAFVLTRLPLTRYWGEQLESFALQTLEDFALAIARAIPGLVIASLIFLLAWLFTRFVGSVLELVERDELHLNWLSPETVTPTRRLAGAVIWLFALAMAYPYLPGAQTEAFKGLSVLVGLMISLGASSVVGQAASGLILMYGRPYKAGEFVRLGETEGTVDLVGLFATRLRTATGHQLSVPNNQVMSQTIRNLSRSVDGNRLALDTGVTIGYDTPWRQVEAMLIEAAHLTPGVAHDVAPIVIQTALSDFYPEYRLICHSEAGNTVSRPLLMNRLHASIQDVFNRYGVQIMSPNYEADPEQAKLVPPSQWYAAPAKQPPAG